MDSFSDRLLAWYDRHARKLPWRVPPEEGKLGIVPDPYHVWLSEVMLQQTTVATVKSYFEKFKTLWPDVDSLAAADVDDVMRAWAGLGYYSRARNLKACADIVAGAHSGNFPKTQTELQKLPGIGDYTSAAIATIAFGESAAVVDGNVERVVTRHTANGTPVPKVKEDCRGFMQHESPHIRPGDFVQAMMDLGATICTPKNPACGLCPVNQDCAGRNSGTMLDYPVKAPKKHKPIRRGAAYVLMGTDNAIWLSKRPEKGLLGGMAGVPTTGWTASIDGETGTAHAPVSAAWKQHAGVRHTFTHFHLELEVWSACGPEPQQEGWWSAPHELPSEALPTVFKKVVTAALPNAFKSNTSKT